MAIRLDATGDYLERSTNVVDFDTNYTLMGWFYISVDTAANAALMTLRLSNTDYDIIVLGSGTTLAAEVRVNGAVTTSTGTTLSTATWYHITAVRSSATLLTVYLDEVSDLTNTRTVVGRSAGLPTMRVGYFDTTSPVQFNGRFYGLKYWDTDLSLAEIHTEKHSVIVKTKLSNNKVFSPHMAGAGERLRDYSQFADDWTANGTLTDEAPPPVSWGNAVLLNPFVSAAISAVTTGTATASITESDIIAGGKTIILTLTGDTWVAAGATFDAQRQNIIDGIDSAQAEGTGWDAEVKAKEVVTAVVRTSSTVVTVTLTAAAAYDITAQETITATIPATALVTSASAIVASPTFTVDAVAAGATIPVFMNHYVNQGIA